MPHLPWTDSMLVILLNIVLVKGAHISPRNKINEVWNDVLNEFFSQEELLRHREAHYRPNDYRKIKDKYHLTLKMVKTDIDKGNQSGKEGEQSTLYKFVKQILDEVDEAEEGKTQQKANKAEMEAVEETLLRKMRGSKRKSESGSDEKEHKSINSFETQLINFTSRQQQNFGEEEFEAEKALMRYIDNEKYTVEQLFINMDEHTKMLLDEITMRVIINLYCSKGEKFGPKYFKESMKEMEVSPLACHKIYTTLEEWRIKSTDKQAYFTPDNDGSSSSTKSLSFNE